MAPTSRDVTHTGLKRRELIGLLEGFGTKDNEIEVIADQLITKFKWIPRAISFFFQSHRVLLAYVEDRDPDDDPATDAEKKEHSLFVALHPFLEDFIKYILELPELIDPLAAVIDHHVSEGRNSDTSTLRANVTSFIPKNPKRDIIDPPITCKSEQGFNHIMTGALLCPLKHRREYDQDPVKFNNSINEGEFEISDKLFPSAFYPSGTAYNTNSVALGLFRGHAFIRAMRAILSGKASIHTGKRTASKASQAEMHNLERVTPEIVAYIGTHLVFALSSIDNWGLTSNCGFNYPRFFDRILRMFTEPEDTWSKETLDFLTAELPDLRAKQTKKRKRCGRNQSEEEDDDDETSISLKQRAAVQAQDVTEADPPEAPAAPLPRIREVTPQETAAEDAGDAPATPRPAVRCRRIVQTPSPSPGDEPPLSSSPAPHSPPQHSPTPAFYSSPHRSPAPDHTLMGPPPPPTLTSLSNLTNLLGPTPRRPSFLGRPRGRSPTLELESQPLPLSARRSTLRSRTGTTTIPSDSISASPAETVSAPRKSRKLASRK